MKGNLTTKLAVYGFILTLAAAAFGQDAAQTQPAPAAASQTAGTTVPRLVSFSGALKDSLGKPLSGPLSVTFSLFAEQEGGTALWSETQIVEADAQGKYTVFLGATSPGGLPLDLFTTGAARWLAVEPGVPAAVELSRILLVGVPYALKAADADTLGGKPASAFLTAAAQPAQSSASPGIAVTVPAASGVTSATAPTGGGTTDYVPLWTSSTNLGNSILFQGSGYVSVGGTLELPASGTATAVTGYDSRPFDLLASVYNSSVSGAVAQHFRWEAEPVSNDTRAASGKIDLLYASGTSTPAETGLSISSKGVLTFASGQTFPGTGPGTITGVTAGTDLTGGGTSGKLTLNLDTTKVPQLNASNTFTGNQSVTGSISLTGTLNGGFGYFGGSLDAGGTNFGIFGYENDDSNFAYGIEGVAYGGTQKTFGVEGISTSPAGVGVYGQLVGASSEGANGQMASVSRAGVWGDTNQDDILTPAVLGTADDAPAGAFYNNSEIGPTLYLEDDTTLNPYPEILFVQGVQGTDNYCYIDGGGDLYCTGSKSALVPVDSGTRKVALYAVETPENWFEDAGSGQLSGGAATINLEPTFAQTVNAGTEYHVFLTPKGECEVLYVTNETAQSFEVHESHGGHSDIAFDYRIMAKRKGYENIRLADKTNQTDRTKLLRRKTAGVQKSLTTSGPTR